MIAAIIARALEIPFKVAFSHASASRDTTHSVWVEATTRQGATGYGEGCPREYVTGETLGGALAFIAARAPAWRKEIHDLESLAAWTHAHRADIDTNPSAWCAAELAFLDALSRQAHKTVEDLLDLPEMGGGFRYTAVLGDSAARRFETELSRYRQVGFRDFKIKLSGDFDRDLDKIVLLKSAGIAPASVRADANNLWKESGAAIDFLSRLDYPFRAIEEPLLAGDHDGMDTIAAAIGCAIILDESLLRADQLSRFADDPARWIVNLRISKMGGLLRSLELVDHVRRAGMGLIVGAHVGETSLLTRAALTIANSASDLLVAQEGAFGTHLLEHDVVDPPLMFGGGGMLDARDIPPGTGFGLAARLPAT